MDGEANITSSVPNTIAPAERIADLVRGLEVDGYLIGLDRTGTGYWVKMPAGPTPDVCGLMKMNDAFRGDRDLRAHLLPWLLEHRPYQDWAGRIAQRSRADKPHPPEA